MSKRSLKEKNIASGKRINLALFVLIIILSAGIVIATGLKNVVVEGVTRYTPQQFYDTLGHEGVLSNTLLFYLKNTLRKKKDIPFVDDYNVTLIDRNSIHIRVYENEVTGCIEIMGSYLCFDKDGFITETLSERPKEVPCVTGLDFDEAVVFKQLNIKKQSIFEDVLQITMMLRKYKVPVYEINFSDAGEVTLYGEHFEADLGRKKDYDIKIAALGGVYEKASEIGGVLDMRNYSEEKTDIILKPYEKEEEKTDVENSTNVE